MEAAIDRIMQTYNLLANRTAAASAEAVVTLEVLAEVIGEYLHRRSLLAGYGRSCVAFGSKRDLPHPPALAKLLRVCGDIYARYGGWVREGTSRQPGPEGRTASRFPG